MFAIRQHTFGPPETLSYERVPDPEPAPGQLRIAVRAAGVHLLDTMLRTGRYGGAMPAPRLPMTPGREVAGTVDAVGGGVDVGWVGTGGLGSLFVQAARRGGAYVVGLAGGPAKVKRPGADVAVDYREADWSEQVTAALGDRVPSLVLDGVGGTVGRRCMELLGVAGRLVVVGWSGEPTRIGAEDVTAKGLTVTALDPRLVHRSELLAELETRALAEVAAGRLLPVVDSRFPLARAGEAHAALEARGTVGKTILEPWS
jgi:NADPH2:quinone reductase